MKRVCGKARCKCARGEKHVSLYLATRVGKARKMIYVPGELEEKVRRWVEEGKKVDGQLEAIAEASLNSFLNEKENLRAKREKKAPRSGARRRKGREK